MREATGGGGSFSEQRLVEKLNKLNNSAASIQSTHFLFSFAASADACRYGPICAYVLSVAFFY
jgi:hypothetical protein